MLDSLACSLVRLAGAILCRLPPSFAVGFGQALGRLAMALQPKRRRMAASNLRTAFDGALPAEKIDAIVRQCFEQMGAALPELLRLPVIDEAYIERFVTIDGRRRFEDAVVSGRPVILLTAHYGNWELSSIVAALKGRPIVALARAQSKFPRLYKLLIAYRESKGCRVAHKGPSLKLLIGALKQGGIVGILGDQANRQGVLKDFFGRPAYFAIGPFELAHAYRAIILPVFMHRLRGPYHRLAIDAPIDLSQSASREEAINDGAERFSLALSRHIREDPGQWLWMHNRWKFTPARRAVILSDGKAGHVKQSHALIQLMREKCADLTSRTIEVRYRSGFSRAVCLLGAAWLPGAWLARPLLSWALDPACAREVLSQQADTVVSAGSVAAPANRLWSSLIRARSAVIMDPSPIPASRFTLVLAPRHDRLKPGKNLVETAGALALMRDEDLRRAAERLPLHPRYRPANGGEDRHPLIAVFVGGDTDDYRVDAAFAGKLLDAVLNACEALDAWCAVTTSRRTPAAAEAELAGRLERSQRCRIFVRASTDPLAGTMDGLLGMADTFVVTGESISMVSEAIAAGRRVLAVEPPLRSGRQPATKHKWFLEDAARQGWLELAAPDGLESALKNNTGAAAAGSGRDRLASVRAAVERLV